MKKYFYLKNGQQVGPFSYDELWNQKITPETKVWYEGMADWKDAKTIPEFANWFPQQTVAQKRPQQPRQKPQQPSRPIQRKTVKRKKSNRGIIGVLVFLLSIVFIWYLYSQKSDELSGTSGKEIATNNSKSNTKKRSSKKSTFQIQIPAINESETYTKTTYPLNPDSLGNEIASFLGTARTSFSNTKLLFMDLHAGTRFQYLIDTYSEKAIQMLFHGLVPSIKYQSPTSALVIFYNPWNDLVLITDWHLFKGELFINDIELVTADYLKYDGLGLGQLAPLWARDKDELPIEALTNSLENREELFDDIWGEMTGTGAWRELLFCLNSTELLVTHQAVVAFRLRDHFLGMQNLLRGEEMTELKNLLLPAMKTLHSGNEIGQLLASGAKTPEIVEKNFSIFPVETWEKSSLQLVRRVKDGAFVFITSPKLTKTFLSFYYKYDQNKELHLERIDWCTFDNEL